MNGFSAVVLALTVMVGCQHGDRFEDRPFLFDFETDGELDYITWKCGELFERTTDFRTSGQFGLRLTLFERDSIGLRIHKFREDWRGFQRLKADIYNPQDTTIALHFRTSDIDYAAPEEFFNLHFLLQPGLTRITIPLDSLRLPDSGRPLDKRHVKLAEILVYSPRRGTVLYFDHLRLE
ncbi:MAG: hypothetical protein Q9P14_11355 [candidate division KSB1 bacterium]|nr:hypothetical protein [candidate division KSB1 bacterium]